MPARLLDAETAGSCCAGERALVREKDGNVLLSFMSEEEEGGD
jgi:hypothetical protein